MHDLSGRDDGYGPAVRTDQAVSHGDLAHGRPAARGDERGVERERLADGRPCGDDDHLARVQAVGEGVQVGEAGRHPGHSAATAADGLDLVQGPRHDVRQGEVVLADAMLGDPVNLGLCPVHEFVGVTVAGVPELHDAGADLDQAAEDRALPDDPGVVAGVGRGGHGRDERVQVRATADAAQFTALAQQVADRHGVSRLTTAVELQDGLVHDLVCRAVVILRADGLHDVGDSVLGHQHSAENALLGSHVVRWRPVELPPAGRDLGDTHLASPFPVRPAALRTFGAYGQLSSSGRH